MSVLTKGEYRRLGSKEFRGYAKAGFLDPRDGVLDGILARIVDGKAFAETSSQLSPGQRHVFGVFAVRAASIAVRTTDPDMVRRAIISVAMALDGALDNKDELLQVPLALRSAERLAMDLSVLMPPRRLMARRWSSRSGQGPDR